MKVPKIFVPNKRSKAKRLIKGKNKIKNIEDFVLEPAELGVGELTDFEDFAESLELSYFYHIKEEDLSDAICIFYDCEFPEVQVFEFRTEELLKKRMKDVYAEANPQGDPLHDARPLIVEKYALILIGIQNTKAETDCMEKVYMEKFGAKRLLRRESFELK